MGETYPLPRSVRDEILTATADQTEFGPFDWILFDALDVAVFVNDALVEDGFSVVAVEIELDEMGGEIVTVSELPGLFKIVFDEGLDADDEVRVRGQRIHERETNVTRAGAVRSAPLETELDKLTVVVQELRRDVPFADDELVAGAQAALAQLARDAAEGHSDTAAAAAAAAIAAAAGVNLPSIEAGDGGKFLRVKDDETGYEHSSQGTGDVTGPPIDDVAPGEIAQFADSTGKEIEGTGLLARTVRRTSPIDYGAAGDGTTDDGDDYETTQTEEGRVYLPEGAVFNVDDLEPATPVHGPGRVKADGVTYGQFEPVVQISHSSLRWGPTDPRGLTWMHEEFPVAAGGHSNTVLGVGIVDQYDDVENLNVNRSTLIGSLVASEIEDCDRTEAIGQGALRHAKFSQRNTILGTIGMQWLGRPPSELADRYHDFYYPTLPSNGAWDVNGIESDNPGMRALIAAVTDGSAASSSDDVQRNTSIARDSIHHLINGINNVGVGYRAGAYLFLGSGNTYLGTEAGENNVFGNDNTMIGMAAGEHWSNCDRCVLIGHDAGRQQTQGDDKFIIQNLTGVDPIMHGQFGASGELFVRVPTSINGVDTAAGSLISRFAHSLGGAISVEITSRGVSGSSGWNTANTCLKAGTAETTGRSINAGGTINAGGADYAEYREVKEHLYGGVPKGALLGMAADGLLTDRWDEVAGRIYIKSTAPNLVGNDQWGRPERIAEKYNVEIPGDEPKVSAWPTRRHNEADDLFTARCEQRRDAIEAETRAHTAWKRCKRAFDRACEKERRRWDRVALCGLVPANIDNVTKDDLGKYLVPSQAPDGTIAAEIVAEDDLTLKQYIRAFGIVEAIGDDGRPLVSVKVN